MGDKIPGKSQTGYQSFLSARTYNVGGMPATFWSLAPTSAIWTSGMRPIPSKEREWVWLYDEIFRFWRAQIVIATGEIYQAESRFGTPIVRSRFGTVVEPVAADEMALAA